MFSISDRTSDNEIESHLHEFASLFQHQVLIKETSLPLIYEEDRADLFCNRILILCKPHLKKIAQNTRRYQK